MERKAEGDGSRGPRAAASGLLLVSFLRRAVASEMQVIRTRIHLWLIGGLLRWGGRRRFLAPPFPAKDGSERRRAFQDILSKKNYKNKKINTQPKNKSI